MSYISEKYINLNNSGLYNILGIQINQSIHIYNKYYNDVSSSPEKINQIIKDFINSYLDEKYRLLNIINADINYYIEHINLLADKKFKDVIKELNLEHLLSILDYGTNNNVNYLYLRNEYYKVFFEKIINGIYKPIGYKINNKLDYIINEEWNKINFNKFIEFSKVLNKLKYFGNNVDNYIKFISDKFDSDKNIQKLLDYINKVFCEEIQDDAIFNNIDDEIECYIKNPTKYDFRFIVDNLKSCGYLLFEKYNKHLLLKYKNIKKIELIKKDKKLINYFLFIISKKESNTVNKKVIEILLRIKNYIFDIEDSHYNNIAYQKITVKQESDKYKHVDLTNLKRSDAVFTILKYSNKNSNDVSKFNLNNAIEPYFDIYEKYYNSRYPDREIEFDPFLSTLIIKIKFLEKKYFIHLALIQYIILDIIYNNTEGINIYKISEKSGIKIEYLEETINSLLKIKIIKRTDAKSIEDVNFFLNNDFKNDSNKISICSLVIKENMDKTSDKKYEYLFDRKSILLSNLYDYVKKNSTFVKDILINELEYKVPFKITQNQIDEVIEILLSQNHIIKINLSNNDDENNNEHDILFQLV